MRCTDGPYFQFRGSIHHFELHSKELTDEEVGDIVATLVADYLDASTRAPGGCSDCPPGFSDDDSDPSTA